MRSEKTEQVTFVSRVRHFYPGTLVFAIPNGGNRNAKEAAGLKREGVLAGVPDLMIAEPRGGFCGLFIEMKRKTGGRVSAEQKELISKLRARGYRAEVARGVDEAWALFEEYMLG